MMDGTLLYAVMRERFERQMGTILQLGALYAVNPDELYTSIVEWARTQPISLDDCLGLVERFGPTVIGRNVTAPETVFFLKLPPGAT